MTRWSNFFPAFPLASQGLPGLCNLSVSTSFCKADSIKITPVAQRERVTGVSLILAIGFVPFVFSARVTALPASRTGRRINCLCPDQPFWRKATVAHLFDVMSKHISLYSMTMLLPLKSVIFMCIWASFYINLHTPPPPCP